MEKPDLTLFPPTPGVYLYKDAGGRILYVGKARRLRQRIASYFRDEAGLTPKTRVMIRQAKSIDILRTGTEKEALLLEASLIKKHRPRYNIVLRDDKEHLLFRIGADHPYPRVEIIRRNNRKGKDKGARIFGPFSSGGAARETWRLIHDHFSLRRCRDRAFANRTRPCLYHDMGKCPAPCVLPVPKEEYQAALRKVELLLSGRSPELVTGLKEEMGKASDALQFERAARLRDQIRAVEHTLERQSVALSRKADLDIAGVAETPEGLALGIVMVRQGLLLDGQNFFWPGLSVEETPELITSALAQFYLARRDLGDAIPPRIVVPWLPDRHGRAPAQEEADPDPPGEDASTLLSLEAALTEFKGSPVHISGPKNPDEDRLALMAAANAAEAARMKAVRPMAELLAAKLQAKEPIRRIEVVDISHTGGRQTKAGMVVFEDEEPVPDAFRQYNLDNMLEEREAEAGDDYAALAAWAQRRVSSGPPWPDLLLVDGGKGQLAAVRRVFEAHRLTDAFILASIAKARTEDGRADRRAGSVEDRIFLPGRSNPVALPGGSPELLFLQRVRDAAHDYVLGRHRKARSAAALSGELTRLPGVGPKTARLLFERFGSLAAMAEAGEEGLTAVPGIGRERARLIAGRLALLVPK